MATTIILRRNHIPSFKAEASVAAIKGEKTLIELAQVDGLYEYYMAF